MPLNYAHIKIIYVYGAYGIRPIQGIYALLQKATYQHLCNMCVPHMPVCCVLDIVTHLRSSA